MSDDRQRLRDWFKENNVPLPEFPDVISTDCKGNQVKPCHCLSGLDNMVFYSCCNFLFSSDLRR